MSKNHLNFDHETKGWVDLIQPRAPRPKLTSHIDTRWLVIGAGFTGLSCARRLAELNPGEKIVLLDAREVGQSASGRNSGYAVALVISLEAIKKIRSITMKGLIELIRLA